MKKALLFINGNPPKSIPDLGNYGLIACTDGAFHYLELLQFPLHQLDFVSGDFDSYIGEKFHKEVRFIFTPDQDKTDFEKALEIISERGYSEVDVFGASGGEMDQYLGNLFVALKMKSKMKISFFDEFSTYFFTNNNIVLNNVFGKNISLYPFPSCNGITTKGLQWEIKNNNLSLHTKMGIRNLATEEIVTIDYQSGELLIFIEI
ncbi:MAG: thiamine diphosphokinase [Bacteroidetes bacterium]|nr:thiamine diphosphokinase [Bacteroidota bacterium]